MVTANEAWDIVRRNNPGMKPHTCNETKLHFIFGLLPEDIDDVCSFTNGAVFMVAKKTGEYEVVPWFMAVDDPVINEINVSIFEW